MREIARRFKPYNALGIASALVWGVVELVALQRAQYTTRELPKA